MFIPTGFISGCVAIFLFTTGTWAALHCQQTLVLGKVKAGK